MATLAQKYYAKLKEANDRVFELEVALAAQESGQLANTKSEDNGDNEEAGSSRKAIGGIGDSEQSWRNQVEEAHRQLQEVRRAQTDLQSQLSEANAMNEKLREQLNTSAAKNQSDRTAIVKADEFSGRQLEEVRRLHTESQTQLAEANRKRDVAEDQLNRSKGQAKEQDRRRLDTISEKNAKIAEQEETIMENNKTIETLQRHLKEEQSKCSMSQKSVWGLQPLATPKQQPTFGTPSRTASFTGFGPGFASAKNAPLMPNDGRIPCSVSGIQPPGRSRVEQWKRESLEKTAELKRKREVNDVGGFPKGPERIEASNQMPLPPPPVAVSCGTFDSNTAGPGIPGSPRVKLPASKKAG